MKNALHSNLWRYRLASTAWPVWSGLALTVLAVASGPVWVDGLRADAEVAAQRAQQALRNTAPPTVDAKAAANRATADFEQALPGAETALTALQDLHRLAQAHGVVLASGDYRLVEEGAGRWQRYQITLPAQGDDRAVRAWMADAMARWPALSLDDWSLLRDSAAQAQVQGRVRWSVYLRAPA